eukprot:6409723-Amphidinium_carterae.1
MTATCRTSRYPGDSGDFALLGALSQELDQHLAASNKPSALVSMKLSDLRCHSKTSPPTFRQAERAHVDNHR